MSRQSLGERLNFHPATWTKRMTLQEPCGKPTKQQPDPFTMSLSWKIHSGKKPCWAHALFQSRIGTNWGLSRQKIKKNSSSKQHTSKPNNNRGSQSLAKLSESLAWGKNSSPARKGPVGSAPWNRIKPPFVAASSREGQRAPATAAFLNDRGLQHLPHPSLPPAANPGKLSAYSWLGLHPFSEFLPASSNAERLTISSFSPSLVSHFRI